MKVLFVTSEIAPFTKTKELANVSYYLPKYLSDKGLDIRVVTTKYRNSNIKKYKR